MVCMAYTVYMENTADIRYRLSPEQWDAVMSQARATMPERFVEKASATSNVLRCEGITHKEFAELAETMYPEPGK